MILHTQDWKRYPAAIVHYKSKNTTWVRLAQVLAAMGVRNCLFFLALLDSTLEFVDPHDPNLDIETKKRIGAECIRNPWYFFREVLRAPAKGGLRPNQFRANRGNIAMLWVVMHNIDCGLIQPRQTGKSLSADAWMTLLIYIAARNARINLITKDDVLRKENVERLKQIRDLLPPYLLAVTKEDSDNIMELTCNALGNKYRTGVAQKSESGAIGLGRGLTTPIQEFDETAFITNLKLTLSAALSAGTAARAEAERDGQPNANLFTTTAGKLDDDDGAYAYELFSEAASWDEAFYDAVDHADLVEMIKKNKTGRKLMVNITMSHRQLGYTDEYIYEAIVNSKSDGDAADRDYFNRWTSGSIKSPLSIALNETIRRSHQDQVWMEFPPDTNMRYGVRWYHDKLELDAMRAADVKWIIGLDTSDAVGRDSIAMVITNTYDLSTVGVGSYNETNLLRFARYLCWFMVTNPNTILVIERRSSAQSMIDALIVFMLEAGIDPFKRMYSTIVDQHIEEPRAYREVCNDMRYRSDAFYDQGYVKGSFGFATDAAKRHLLYSTVLQNAAKQAGNAVKDLGLINEITRLVEKNGRIDHGASGHDDHVIAWLLCHWFMFHTKNLAHYGLTSNNIAVGASSGGEVSVEDQRAKREQERLLRRVEEIDDELARTRDMVLKTKLEMEQQNLIHKLRAVSVSATNLDALLQQAQEERDKRRIMGGENQQRPLSRPINVTMIARSYL